MLESDMNCFLIFLSLVFRSNSFSLLWGSWGTGGINKDLHEGPSLETLKSDANIISVEF